MKYALRIWNVRLAGLAGLACLVALATLAAPLLGCAGGEEPAGEQAKALNQGRSQTELPDPNGRSLPTLGEPVMVALAQAKNFHHKADIYLREGELAKATDAVREILAVPFPEGAAEAEDVKLDARARLAKLLVAQGKTDEAMEVVDAGIAEATRRSFFLANLYTVKGEVYEAKANLLDEAGGDEAAARAARIAAIQAFDESIAINRELQKALMSGTQGDGQAAEPGEGTP